jgi:hypothetical protein
MRSHITAVLICFIYLGIAAGSVPIAAESTAPRMVVFDSSTGFFGLDDYGRCGLSEIRDELLYRGYDAQESISLGQDCEKITTAEIYSGDLFCIVNPNRMLSQEEKRLIMDYVSKGKWLLLVCDENGTLDNANSLASIFGMRFEDDGFSGDAVIDVNGTEVIFTDPLKIVEELGNTDEFRISKEERTVFQGMAYGLGKVGLLADQSILLNEYVEDHGPYFASSLFQWYMEKDSQTVTYNPDTIVIAGEQGSSILIIENSGSLPQNFNISFTSNLGHVLISERDFTLKPGEKKFLNMTLSTAGNLYGFMTVKRNYIYGSKVDYIPLEVV